MGVKAKIKRLRTAVDSLRRTCDVNRTELLQLRERVMALEAYQKSILLPVANHVAEQSGGSITITTRRAVVDASSWESAAKAMIAAPRITTFTVILGRRTWTDGKLTRINYDHKP